MAAGKLSCRGRRTVVPPPANSPRLGSMTPKVASGVAMRMSTPPSISIPPATHGPPTAAMIGLKIFTLRSTAYTLSERRQPSTSFTSPAAISFWSLVTWGMKVFRSAPAMKASSTPVMMATHTSGSSLNRRHAAAKSRKWYMSSALRVSGLSIVMTATWSSAS